MDLSLSGLASGFDWKTMINQLVAVEQAPESVMRTQQDTLNQRNNAYGSIKTELSALSTRVDKLKDASLYAKQLATTSDATIATATSSGGGPLGTFTLKVTQLASASIQQGTKDIASPLSASSDVSGVVLGSAGFKTAISAGTFTVNGAQITINTTDTLQSVFDQISTATSGAVTASYDSTSDKITLSSSGEVVLGSAVDSSNFLQVAGLMNNGTGTVTSNSQLGSIRAQVKLTDANLATAVTAGAGGAGEFKINGVSIAYNVANDSITNVLDRINNSAAGVTATYDSLNDRFVLTNKTTGDTGISLQDVTGNFLEATGLSNGTLQHGNNLLYTINGGTQLASQSNTITQASSGIAGISINVVKEGSTAVSISTDTSTIKRAITDFVEQYNKVQSLISNQTASTTDSTGKVTAGILSNDGDADDIVSSLRQTANAQLTDLGGTLKSLEDLGIAANGYDNTLSVGDGTKLDEALVNQLSQVQTLFTDSDNGLAVKLSKYLNGTIGDTGTLITKQGNLTKQASDIDTQIADMERNIQAYKDRLTAEFIAMETAQAKINQQMSYLTQTFGSSSLISSASSSSSR